MSERAPAEGSAAGLAPVVDPLRTLTAAFRARGGRAGLSELLNAHRALAAADCGSREDARLALRAVLCSQQADLVRFDRAFASVFGAALAGGTDSPLAELGAVERVTLPRAGIESHQLRPEPGEAGMVPAAWSDVELLHEKDFAEFTEAEAVIARELIERLARRGPTRLSRRTRPTRRRDHAPDLRRVIRASLRAGGEPVYRHWRSPTRRPRPLVLVCDVSGSMTPYTRMLLQFLHACVEARRRVEAFGFGTRLTRITNELAGRDHDQALERVAGAVTDWSGGTRIGAALGELNRVHGRRLGRGGRRW